VAFGKLTGHRKWSFNSLSKNRSSSKPNKNSTTRWVAMFLPCYSAAKTKEFCPSTHLWTWGSPYFMYWHTRKIQSYRFKGLSRTAGRQLKLDCNLWPEDQRIRKIEVETRNRLWSLTWSFWCTGPSVWSGCTGPTFWKSNLEFWFLFKFDCTLLWVRSLYYSDTG